MPTTTDAPEGLDLRKDGTVFLHLDDEGAGKTRLIRLRRPKMSELRQLRQDLWDITAEITEFTTKNQQRRADIHEQHGINPADKATMKDTDVEVLAELRDLTRDLIQEGTTLTETLRLPWAAQVIEMLGGIEVDPDDLPPWCATKAFGDELMEHWFQVPTRRGGA